MIASPFLLKTARQALGMSQEDVAKLAGLHRRTVQELETGDDRARIRTAVAVQRAFEALGVRFLAENEAIGEGLRFPKSRADQEQRRGSVENVAPEDAGPADVPPPGRQKKKPA